MSRFWCRLIGCRSIFAWWFRWPWELCFRAADRHAAEDELFTWDPSPLIPLEEVNYRVDDHERVVYSRYEWKR